MNILKISLVTVLCASLTFHEAAASVIDGSISYGEMVEVNSEAMPALQRALEGLRVESFEANLPVSDGWSRFGVVEGIGTPPDAAFQNMLIDMAGPDVISLPKTEIALDGFDKDLLEVTLQDDLILVNGESGRFWTRRKIAILGIATVMAFAGLMFGFMSAGAGSGAGAGFGGGGPLNSPNNYNPGPNNPENPKDPIIPPPTGPTGPDPTDPTDGDQSLPSVPSNPEPSTLILFGLGAFLPFLRKRKS